MDKFLQHKTDVLEDFSRNLGENTALGILFQLGHQPLLTAIFILVVSSAVILHYMSARAGDVSMGIAVFPNGRILLLPFKKLSND